MSARFSSNSKTKAPQRERAFEEFFVARKANRSLNITSCFPGPAHRLNQKFPNVVLFCFPDRAKTTGPNAPPPKALRFTFVLTNEMGERLFGHSIQLIHGDLICFISKFCWVRFFDEILYRYRMNGQNLDEVIAFYNSQVPFSMGVFHNPVALPPPTSSLATTTASSSSQSQSTSNNNNNNPSESIANGLRRPNDSGNAFVDVRLAKALEFLTNDALLQTIAALMCEARVVIVGQRIMDISDVVLAVVALLQPFDWQHVLIPVLPNDLLDVLCSPTPFLIGLLAGQIPAAAKLPTEDTVVVVLGRDGGDGCYVRKGIPSEVPTTMESFPDSGTSAPVNARTEQEIEERLEAELMYGPVLKLPFTDSSLCSIRVGLFQARRLSHNEMHADQALLAAFHDYYVFTFGLVFASDFTPTNFTMRMVAKNGAELNSEEGNNNNNSGNNNGQSQQQLQNGKNNKNDDEGMINIADETTAFFERVSNGMMLSELRARMANNLQEANDAALEMKKHHLHQFAFSGEDRQDSAKKGSTTTTSPSNATLSRSFKPSSSDVFEIRRILRSEFLEAVLERFPLLYPHAAQVLAYSTNEELMTPITIAKNLSSSSSLALSSSNPYMKKLNGTKDSSSDYMNKTNGFGPAYETSARTVLPLEAADLLRRFASWCSYGVTSTVQKISTSGNTASQTRAELEEL
jgi:hypothetical protein